jgi:hypothetical protein
MRFEENGVYQPRLPSYSAFSSAAACRHYRVSRLAGFTQMILTVDKRVFQVDREMENEQRFG